MRPACQAGHHRVELRQLRQLLVLAETRNFHRAAERLHMAQPPLSTSIRKLEDELGVSLFERRPGALQLTAAGERVLPLARRAVACSEQIAAAAADCASGELGRLSLGFVGTATYSLLPRLIPAFRQAHPRVDLVLRESTTTELLRQLSARSLDLALVRWPVLQPRTELTLRLLETDVWMLAVHSDSPLALHDRVALCNLGDEVFIGYSAAQVPAMHAVSTLAWREAGIQPRVAQEATQVQTLFSLVASGLGVAMVPAVAASNAGQGVKLLALEGVPPALGIGLALAVHADNDDAPTQRFIELATALTSATPGAAIPARPSP